MAGLGLDLGLSTPGQTTGPSTIILGLLGVDVEHMEANLSELSQISNLTERGVKVGLFLPLSLCLSLNSGII